MGKRTLGEKIRVARKRKGITQEELASLCGTSVASISRTEKGVSQKPHYDLMMGIATSLQVDLRKEMVKLGYSQSQISEICEKQYSNWLSSPEDWLDIRHLSNQDRVLMRNMYQKISELPQKDKAIIGIILE